MRSTASKRLSRWGNRRGQAMLESAFIFLVVLGTIFGTLDFGQLLFTHQVLVERVRSSLRWAVVRPYDGTGDQIANMILYGQPTASGASGYLGMSRANIRVTYSAGTVDNPNDERLRVSIVDYQFHLFSPWIARTFTNNNAVVESSAMVYKP